MNPVLVADRITKSFHADGTDVATQVLRGASLVVHRGELVALMGPSGAGKSTLLHILATLEQRDDGALTYHLGDRRVDVDGADRTVITELRQSSIGIVFQFHHLLPEFTARENVMMPGLLRGDRDADVARRADVLLEAVGMSHRLNHMPRELSGGEQQRVAIARALVNNPMILFADEPTGNLDQEHAESITQLLLGLSRQHGIACVIATHSTDVARHAHRIVRMVDGVCREESRG